MRTCETMLEFTSPINKKKFQRACGNRVLRFVDQQPDNQCYACYERLEPEGFGYGVYVDPNDGGVPK